MKSKNSIPLRRTAHRTNHNFTHADRPPPSPPTIPAGMTELQVSSNSNGVGGGGGGGRGTGGGGGSGGAGGGNHDDHHGEGSADATAQSATDSQSPPPSATAQSSSGRSPKKRRKVNHGELFVVPVRARFHWPCTALIPHLLFLAAYFLSQKLTRVSRDSLCVLPSLPHDMQRWYVVIFFVGFLFGGRGNGTESEQDPFFQLVWEYESNYTWAPSSVRPCTRCVKRNIGHLCHDEPREPKKHKAEHSGQENGHEDQHIHTSPKASIAPSVNGMSNSMEHQDLKPTVSATQVAVSLGPPPLPTSRTGGGPSTVAPSAVSVTPRSNMNANSQACTLSLFFLLSV